MRNRSLLDCYILVRKGLHFGFSTGDMKKGKRDYCTQVREVQEYTKEVLILVYYI